MKAPLDKNLSENIITDYQAFFDSRIQLMIQEIERNMNKLQKQNESMAMESMDSQNLRDWKEAFEVINSSLGNELDDTDNLEEYLKKTNLFELRKAKKLIDCLPFNAEVVVKDMDFARKFRISEQQPKHWIIAGEERVSQLIKLMQELDRIADE